MVTFCKNCYETKQRESITGYSWALKEGTTDCPWCHSKNSLIKINFPDLDMCDLLRISKSKEFLDAMIELYKKDPIEYELKMSQFRNQANQILKNWKQSQEQNIPKCPTCGSTNIKKISAGSRWLSTGLFGISSGKLGKSMECRHCGYKW